MYFQALQSGVKDQLICEMKFAEATVALVISIEHFDEKFAIQRHKIGNISF